MHLTFVISINSNPNNRWKQKKIKIVSELNNPLMAIGEFTIFEEPVVTVILSKIPAEADDKNKAKIKNMAQ